ncbi:hypothetical protein J2X46_002729 [Nocardioides sp. BE266]|nr:hypothetical protein [Nocardioides sp. BE266]MDR7253739.1 hypothetical protein [Nocardioides sp. BE266]
MTRQPTPADLRRLATHEDAAGNHDRANALHCLIVWMRGGDYTVPGVRNG